MSEKWKTPQFRQNIIDKLNEQIIELNLNVKTDASQMEKTMFEKASTEHEYLAYIARLIVYIKDKERNSSPPKTKEIDNNQTNSSKQNSSYNNNNNITTNVGNKTKLIQLTNKNNERYEPTSSQRFDILKTAIATVIQNPTWQTEEPPPSDSLILFGQYVAYKLNQISSQEQLISTQQNILSILNKNQ